MRKLYSIRFNCRRTPCASLSVKHMAACYVSETQSHKEWMPNIRPARIRHFWRERSKCHLLNQGVGGYIFNADSLDENLPFKPQIVTVAYGTNDWVRYETMAQFRYQCSAYIDAVSRHYSYARIFVMTPIWRKIRNERKPLGTFDELVQTIKEICADHPSIHVIDGESLVAHCGRLFADGTHPTDEGFAHMALNLYKQIHNTL